MFNYRKNALRDASQLLEGRARVVSIGIGRAKFRLTRLGAVLLAIFVIVEMIALANGTIALPGGVLLVVFVLSTMPFRVVAVADRGIALLSMNFFGMKVNEILVLLPHDVITNGVVKSGMTHMVRFGDHDVRLNRKEYNRIREAQAQLGQGQRAA
jgi:hypothetical protein